MGNVRLSHDHFRSPVEWSGHGRAVWLNAYRQARITRGHSGTLADAAYDSQFAIMSPDGILTKFGRIRHLCRERYMRKSRVYITSPNLPAWW